MFYHQQPLLSREEKGLFTFYKQQEQLQARRAQESQPIKKQAQNHKKQKLIKGKKKPSKIKHQKKLKENNQIQDLTNINYNKKQLKKKVYYIPVTKDQLNERRQQTGSQSKKQIKNVTFQIMDCNNQLVIKELKLKDTQEIQLMRKNIESKYIYEKMKKIKERSFKMRSIYNKQNKNHQYQKYQKKKGAIVVSNSNFKKTNLQYIPKVRTVDLKQYSEKIKNQINEKFIKENSCQDLQKNQTKRFLKSLNESRENYSNQKKSLHVNDLQVHVEVTKNKSAHFYCKAKDVFEGIQKAKRQIKKLPPIQEPTRRYQSSPLQDLTKLQNIKSAAHDSKTYLKFEQIRKKFNFNNLKKVKNGLGLSGQSLQLHKNGTFYYNQGKIDYDYQGGRPSLKQRTLKFKEKILNSSSNNI